MKIGILGGGQLGRMFLQEAISLPVKTKVLDPQKNASCAHLCDEFICGDFNDYDTVRAFGIDCDAIGIEIEHISNKGLEFLHEQGKKTVPSPHTLAIIQDKGVQKEFYRQNNIPTIDFYLAEKPRELTNLSFPLVQKTRKGGYDGKGVQVIKNAEEADKIWDTPSVIEKLCDIKKEIAVIIACDKYKNRKIYPIVEMEFDDKLNLVDVVKMPAEISKPAEIKALEIAERLADSFNDSGIFAVEMFIDDEDKVFVNETACRVHNSGHLTIEACETSQFGQMLRILAGLPLGSVETVYKYAAMLNLVGADGAKGAADVDFLKEISALPQTFIHWYGKDEVRPGRKMGHITVCANNAEELKNNIARVKKFSLEIKAK
ncbi:MAG: 5-(carboxyamino)imidazole ribonucleotide synthase [Cardiobacteriaceae bacterium]|nr:5-(carboxyamino)imidazole ribonucleotide synthase [Cardiobacteriaceae bacterium]